MDGKHGSQSQLTIAPHELIQSDFWLSIDWALIFDWAFIGVIPTGFWGKEVSWRVILNSSWQTLFTQLCSRNFEQIWLTQLRGKKWARGISFYFPEQVWAEWAALGRQQNLGRKLLRKMKQRQQISTTCKNTTWFSFSAHQLGNKNPFFRVFSWDDSI